MIKGFGSWFGRRFSRLQGGIIIVGLMASVLILVRVLASAGMEKVSELERPELSAAGNQTVTVYRNDGQEEIVEFNLNPRLLSEQEAEALFDQAESLLWEVIRGENASRTQIDGDLQLPNRLDTAGVELAWESLTPQLLNQTGRLVRGRQQTEPETAILRAEMSFQDYRRTVELELVILPEPEPDWAERLSMELSRLDKDTQREGRLVLPDSFEGEPVSFGRRQDISRQLGLALLPAVGALAVFAEYGQKEDKLKKKRREEILMDYPELIVKMTVLYQAGLSMRSVWERIGDDAKKKGGRIKPIYEEVCFACNSMADGISEAEAYRQFGRRCCTGSCLKLGNLLAGNVRRGTKRLSALMAQESARAWEQRKHLARRSGEKAGTKMLIPMFMMFGVVLAMVVIPAFYSFMI